MFMFLRKFGRGKQSRPAAAPPMAPIIPGSLRDPSVKIVLVSSLAKWRRGHRGRPSLAEPMGSV